MAGLNELAGRLVVAAAASGGDAYAAVAPPYDLALGNLPTWWVYLIGPAAGAVLAVGVTHVLRGPAKAKEATKAMGTPLDRRSP